MTEVDVKVERVARFAQEHRLAGVVLSRQPNFAWLTAGQTNQIDGSVDTGAGSLLISADGDRHVIASNIELPRLRDEALRDLGFSPVEYRWRDDHADPAKPLKLAQQIVRGDIGADVPAPGITDLSGRIASLQTPLTDEELSRYRELARDAANAIEGLCRSLEPGASELEVASEVSRVTSAIGARAIVNLVAADDRIAAFRHPVPTARTWTDSILLGVCAQRHGLVVALSRILSRRPSIELRERTTATAQVFGALLAATQPGVTGAQLYATAANAYRNAGYQGEERLHHQGGAIGYRSRDWIAYSGAADAVQNRQAFAWNPSITGTKVEDTALLVDGTIELVTVTPSWPRLEAASGDTSIHVSGILEL